MLLFCAAVGKRMRVWNELSIKTGLKNANLRGNHTKGEGEKNACKIMENIL